MNNQRDQRVADIVNMLKGLKAVPTPVPVATHVPIVQEQVEKPKIVFKKKKKMDRRPNQKPRQVGIKKSELENTNLFWNSLPDAEYPIVRGLANLLGLNPDNLTSNRASSLKEIVEIASSKVGSDERKIFEWIKQKMREGKISGDRPDSQLKIYLRMLS